MFGKSCSYISSRLIPDGTPVITDYLRNLNGALLKTEGSAHSAFYMDWIYLEKRCDGLQEETPLAIQIPGYGNCRHLSICGV